MPAYNFQKQFADLVESGQKLQTIRKSRKRAKVGDTAYLYTGQRTDQCRKLGHGIITDIYPIEIGFLSHGDSSDPGDPYALIVFMEDGKLITDLFVDGGLDDLAKLDGFTSGAEMIEWFDKLYGLPFTGFLHQWVLKK